MYNDHLRLIGKRVVDFLLVFIELLSLGVKSELGATSEYRLKISDFFQREPDDPKFQEEWIILFVRKLGFT